MDIRNKFMEKKNLLNEKRGFTLIELLVVIAIIGILSSILLTNLNSAKQKAKNAKFSLEANQIALAMKLYYDKNGNWPNYVGAGFMPYDCRGACIPDFANPANPNNKFYSSWPDNFDFVIFDFNQDGKPDVGSISQIDASGVYTKYIPCITSDTFYFDADYCGQLTTPQ